MKIIFHCTCNTYLEAASLEEFLKKEGVEYEERINDGGAVHRKEQTPSKNTTRRRRRHTLDGEAFSHIRNCILQHPNWSDSRIKEHFSLKHSSQTVNRIRNGHYNQRFISTHAKVTPLVKED
mgnify:CR=1 FL=1